MMLVAGLLTAVTVGVLLQSLATPTGAGPRERRSIGSWLRQSGLDVGPIRFVATSLAAGVATFIVALAITGVPWLAVPPALGVGVMPSLWVARRRAGRLDGVAAAWPDALRDLSASVAAGMSLPRALDRLVTSGPPAIRETFEGYPAMARTIGVVPALEAVRDRIADPMADRVIEVLRVAHDRGGSAVPRLLVELADAAAEDLRVDEEIRTESLEQRINARIVFVLPWFVLVMLCAREGPFRDFYASSAGLLVVGIGAIMSAAGALVVGRLGRRAVEHRVLGGET